nr:MAG TPA: hypothetical protein [Bacteriophage sp.]
MPCVRINLDTSAPAFVYFVYVRITLLILVVVKSTARIVFYYTILQYNIELENCK